MTFDSFVTKYNGKFVDYDKKYGYQCVDNMRTYIKEVLSLDGYTLPPVTYAKQLFTNFKTNKYFHRVFNSPTNVPKKGDIIIWNYYPFFTGWAGHVAIFYSGDVNSLITFDQNYPTNSPCHFQKHNYKGVLGWIRRTTA